MFLKFYSPHILIYKPQTNSAFSLFLRFILIAVFVNFILYNLFITFFNNILFNYFLDVLFISEFILIFFALAILGEDLIDYDEININYWDIDLVTFFNFFFNFSLLFIILSLFFLISKIIFWATVIAV